MNGSSGGPRATLRAASPMRSLGRALDADKMARLGISNTMRLAKLYNGFRNRGKHDWRRRLWRQEFESLAGSRAAAALPPIRMEDGYAIAEPGTLPGLEELLAAADEIIAERAGSPPVDDRYRAFFRNLVDIPDHARWPQLIDFIATPEAVSIAADYLGFVPALTKTLPTGVRVVESGRHLDALAHLPPRDSQVFHIDPYDRPMVYVIVLCRDTDDEMGPFTFIPAAASARAAKRLDYWKRGRPYRLSDEEVYSVVDPGETIRFTHPRGTALFIDTSRCFHFGARDGNKPRFQIMYGLSSVCRSDFSESYMERFTYPLPANAPRLTRILCERDAIDI